MTLEEFLYTYNMTREEYEKARERCEAIVRKVR